MQKRFIHSMFMLLLGLLASSAWGLQFGEIKVNSYLHQPLNAHLALSDAQGEVIQLASKEAYDESGVAYYSLYRTLKLERLQDKLVFVSKQRIESPFLQLMLHIKKQDGEQFRLFTLLLDPIDYAYDYKSAENKKDVQSAPAKRYQVKANDTLSEIVLEQMPSDDTSLTQRMDTLFKQNPHAFIDNDINKIKVGQTLRIPNMAQPALAKPSNKASSQPVADGKTALSAQAAHAIENTKGQVRLLADAAKAKGGVDMQTDSIGMSETQGSLSKPAVAGINSADSAKAQSTETDNTEVATQAPDTNEQVQTQHHQAQDETLSGLENKVQELETQLKEKDAQQQALRNRLDDKQPAGIAAAIKQAGEQIEYDLRSKSDEISWVWIVPAGLIFVLLFIFILYKWRTTIVSKRESYELIPDIELFSEDAYSNQLRKAKQREKEVKNKEIIDELTQSVNSSAADTTEENKQEPLQSAATDKVENDKVENDKVENEKVENEKVENEKVENEKVENEKVENEKVENDKVESDKVEGDKSETEAVEATSAVVAEVEKSQQELAQSSRSTPSKLEREGLGYSLAELGIHAEESEHSPAQVNPSVQTEDDAQANKAQFDTSALQLEDEPAQANIEPNDGETTTQSAAEADDSQEAFSQEVEDLLNAGKRDVMIGNRPRALQSLNQVLEKGNQKQKSQAQELLKHLGE